MGVRGMNCGIRRARDERGQALVEFVLLLPVFLLVLFGLVEFGKGFNYWIDLTHLANEGSRYASVNRWPTCPSTDTGICPLPYNTLEKYLIDQANTGELREGGTAYVAKQANTRGIRVDLCSPDDGDDNVVGAGDPVRVTVTSRYTLPIVDGLMKVLRGSGLASFDIAASSTMRLERDPTRLGVVPAC
jgi:Flp pilus assembly protein TadG